MTTGAIHRDPAAAADRPHDLIVVGAGIYGACVALEAARRGLHPLLLERADFGSATSRAGLRIIHGGLRYLQTLDLRRARESAREQAWFLSAFPDLVHPLPCLMPLDGAGLRRPSAFRAALSLAAIAAPPRPRTPRRLPRPGVLSATDAARWFPGPRTHAAAHPAGVWCDAVMSCPERLLIEIIRWACARGACALNYVEATELVTEAGRVAGVRARDRATAAPPGRAALEFRAPVVINCAGPWCRALAARFDKDAPALFRPSLAFNILLDLPPPSPMAVAVRPATAGGRAGPRAYFLVPCHGRLMAGTVHAPCEGSPPETEPTDGQLRRFLDELNSAAPGLGAAPRHILSVLSGLLPAAAEGSAHQAERPIIHDHRRAGGPAGLWSLSGVKYTTARAVADRALRRALPRASPPRRTSAGRPEAQTWAPALSSAGPPHTPDDASAAGLRRLVADEAVLHLDDLVLRRTAWGLVPEHALAAGRRACDLLGWDAQRSSSQLDRLARVLGLRPAPREPDARPGPVRSRAATKGGAA